MLSRPLRNERVELPATGSPAVPQLPLAQSSALELERRRLSSHRFIIAHEAVCLKADALFHRGAAPCGQTFGHSDLPHSYIREADKCVLKKTWTSVGERGRERKKWSFVRIKSKPFQFRIRGKIEAVWKLYPLSFHNVFIHSKRQGDRSE